MAIKRTHDQYVVEVNEFHPDILVVGQYCGDKNKIAHRCSCGDVWYARPADVLAGHNCPKCGVLKFSKNHVHTHEWYIKQLQCAQPAVMATEQYDGCNTFIKHRCGLCQYEWSARPKYVLKRGCVKCSCKLSKPISHDEYKIKLNQKCPNLLVVGNYVNSATPILHQCGAGHNWMATPANILNGTGCPTCARQSSRGEEEIAHYIEQLGFTIRRRDRVVLKPQELDILVSDMKLAIEFDGIFWHAEGTYGMLGRTGARQRHLNKTISCLAQNIQLLHIFDVEWYHKHDLVCSKISSILGKNKRIGARDCQTQTISSLEDHEFMKQNHLQGPISAKIRLGLVHNDQLVMMMTFNPHGDGWEIMRMASLLNHNIIGGAAKLLKAFERKCQPNKLLTYADRRWGEGLVYPKLGFEWSHATKPNYWYFAKGDETLQPRVKYQKHKLNKKLIKFDPSLTEWQNMQDNGFDRIWDCGSNVYIKNY